VWKKFSAYEKLWAVAFCVAAILSLMLLFNNFYRGRTSEVPTSEGAFVEAAPESPHNLNPLLSVNDSDRDLSRLIFSSLLKYNEKNELTPDLAESYEISKDGKTYTIKLRNNIFWHDGEQFSASDVVFTVNAAQNPEYNSPLRTGWQSVKAEATDANTVVLTLKTPYSAFAENLALLGILPKHIWEKVVPQNFPLANFNFKPVGTGPYRFVKLQKDALGRIISVTLIANSNYFSSVPFIKNFIFKFYLSEEEAVSAFNRKEADGLLLQTAQNKNQLRGLQNSSVFSLPSLRVYGLFLNTNDPLLGARYIREAISYAVDRKEILSKLFSDEGKIAAGPIPPAALGSSPDIAGYSYDPKKTAKILEKNKWIKNEEGVYEKKIGKNKEASPLKFTIITAKSMELPATLIRDYLKNVGIEADLKILGLREIQQDYLRTKNYNAILIGESYTDSVDPYVFWHGTAIKEPGLNLSLYANKSVNKILEDARQITDSVKRAKKLEEFQKLILKDAPAVFLYSPNYIYVVNNAVRNIKLDSLVIPSYRFSKVNEWYVETKRIWK